MERYQAAAMNTEKISPYQLFALIVYLEIGSAAVIGFTPGAKQDAWLSVTAAALIGTALTAWHSMILQQYPGKNLYEILGRQIGKKGALILTAVYTTYFLYLSARVVRDFCELMNTVIFVRTPFEIIALTVMIVIVYGVYLGIEVLGRTSEIFTPYSLGFLLLVSIMLVFGGDVQLHHILPVLPDGLLPVWKGLFPTAVTFPFGEMVAFLVIGAALKQSSSLAKTMLSGIAASGVLLIYFSFLKIFVLGGDVMERSMFPLLEAAKFVSIANFVERLDALIVFTMMTGLFIKISLFLYAALKGIGFLSGKDYRPFALPMGLLVVVAAIVIASGIAEHVQEGLILVPYWLHLPLQYGVPLVIGLVALRHKKKKRELTVHGSD
ncbi:MAG TPA: endospore germination permease [Paenibacillus sp.]|uniref:GerAB/ArcD/ProY family transporter n=1 Tax=Paenibacillus sp. TaxID=58172 RepID=UPI002B6741ED|nr:endospore germination permease [Paenibacillus sp.]HUC92184.1 endospore germination permease [Paenibacillus sp.]